MSDTEINNAIAEVCPQVACKNINGKWVWVEQQSRFFLPTSDLNAMHEAEKVLTRYQQSVTYSDNLMKIVGYHTFDSAHATARQRAEAFLRTLDKWEEVQP